MHTRRSTSSDPLAQLKHVIDGVVEDMCESWRNLRVALGVALSVETPDDLTEVVENAFKLALGDCDQLSEFVLFLDLALSDQVLFERLVANGTFTFMSTATTLYNRLTRWSQLDAEVAKIIIDALEKLMVTNLGNCCSPTDLLIIFTGNHMQSEDYHRQSLPFVQQLYEYYLQGGSASRVVDSVFPEILNSLNYKQALSFLKVVCKVDELRCVEFLCTLISRRGFVPGYLDMPLPYNSMLVDMALDIGNALPHVPSSFAEVMMRVINESHLLSVPPIDHYEDQALQSLLREYNVLKFANHVQRPLDLSMIAGRFVQHVNNQTLCVLLKDEYLAQLTIGIRKHTRVTLRQLITDTRAVAKTAVALEVCLSCSAVHQFLQAFVVEVIRCSRAILLAAPAQQRLPYESLSLDSLGAVELRKDLLLLASLLGKGTVFSIIHTVAPFKDCVGLYILQSSSFESKKRLDEIIEQPFDTSKQNDVQDLIQDTFNTLSSTPGSEPPGNHPITATTIFTCLDLMANLLKRRKMEIDAAEILMNSLFAIKGIWDTKVPLKALDVIGQVDALSKKMEPFLCKLLVATTSKKRKFDEVAVPIKQQGMVKRKANAILIRLYSPDNGAMFKDLKENTLVGKENAPVEVPQVHLPPSPI